MVGQKVAEAIRHNGYDITVVAEAADMRPVALTERLRGEVSFTFEQLVAVGGFLSFPIPEFFQEVTTREQSKTGHRERKEGIHVRRVSRSGRHVQTNPVQQGSRGGADPDVSDERAPFLRAGSGSVDRVMAGRTAD